MAQSYDCFKPARLVTSKDNTIEPNISANMIPNDNPMGNLPPMSSFNQAIFKPTKTRTSAKPVFKYTKRSITPANIKYNERSPKIAMMLEMKTIMGSFVMA